MKKYVFVVLVFLVLTATAAAVEEQQGPADFIVIIGPRVGVSYTVTTPAEFTQDVQTLYYYGGNYYPVTSIFGIISEQRILLGNTTSHFAFQEIAMVSGLEQSIALPSASLLIGYRDASGFEFGFGPTISLQGVGVVVAIGWTITFQGVFVPVDLGVVIPSQQNPATVSLTTGFNFITRASYF